MYPMGSNGGTQAIVDASVLVESLATARPQDALLAYESERRPPTGELVRLNRLGGPEQVIDVVEDRAPAGFESLDDVISSAELAAIIGGYGRAAGLLRHSTR
jgi:2-polyprenyl-6-methoxyphenol hydroxylase-like FAD-dependent oxidoreductase